jgi:hypothetical protein
MIGKLEPKKLRMPLYSHDKRQLTWTKWIASRSKEIINNPTSNDSCWFVEATKSDGTHQTKISKSGTQDKFQTTRVIKTLQDPSLLGSVEAKDSEDDIHFAHLCNRGRATGIGQPTCINPYHIEVVTSKVNQSHKSCRYGCRFLCPHEKKCFFTWPDTGKVKPCFMNETELPKHCPHDPKCSHKIL